MTHTIVEFTNTKDTNTKKFNDDTVFVIGILVSTITTFIICIISGFDKIMIIANIIGQFLGCILIFILKNKHKNGNMNRYSPSTEEYCNKLENAILISSIINGGLVVFILGIYWGWWV